MEEKTEGWGQKKLADFNRKLIEIYCQYPDDEEIEEMHKRLLDKGKFPIEVMHYSESDNPYKKTKKYRYEMNKRLMDIEDAYKDGCRRCLIICYNILMDMGYGRKRLERIRALSNEKLEEVYFASDNGLESVSMKMHKELMEGVGIIIEMPVLK